MPLRARPNALLAWVAAAVGLLAAALVVTAALTQTRLDWLAQRGGEARLAALAIGGGAAPAAAEALRGIGFEDVRIATPSGASVLLDSPAARAGAPRVLRPASEPAGEAALGALAALFGLGEARLALTVPAVAPQGADITAVLARGGLTTALRREAGLLAATALAVAALIGAGAAAWVRLRVARATRPIVGRIAALRADPERSAVAYVDGGASPSDAASRALAELQRELRAGVWQEARLAALATAMGRLSHDLRGAMSPALLAAERLEGHADAAVTRSGGIVVRTIDRVAELLQEAMDYVRDAPKPPERTRVAVRPAVLAAVEQARSGTPELRVTVEVGEAVEVEAGGGCLVSLFVNLLRNAAEAGAKLVRVYAEPSGGTLAIVVADDAGGLPEALRERPFRPFAAARPARAGVGLAIVRDRMRANRGEAMLAGTGPEGTTFRLVFPAVTSRGRASPQGGGAATPG